MPGGFRWKFQRGVVLNVLTCQREVPDSLSNLSDDKLILRAIALHLSPGYVRRQRIMKKKD